MRALVLALVVACGEPPGGEAVRIAGASPGYGPLVGGTTITITGSGFLAPSRVLIASREAPVASVIDDTRIEVVIPPGEQPGDAEVVVLGSTGSASAVGIFRYSTEPTLAGVTPDTVVFSSAATVMTLTGTGFLDEGAGAVSVVVDSVLATDVVVTSDTELRFTAPLGRPFAHPRITVIDQRGAAVLPRSFRYEPSDRTGLLLVASFGAEFAKFFDPTDNTAVPIPYVPGATAHPTTLVRDEHGDLYGVDRYGQFGKLDLDRQQLIGPIQTAAIYPTMVRAGDRYVGIARIGGALFGSFDPATGAFTQIGEGVLPCCGSFGMAYDGTTLYYASRSGADKTITSLDPITGVAGIPVTITGVPGIHIEDMRFFRGTLYALNRDGTLVTIDPNTGAATVVAYVGRYNALEVYEPESAAEYHPPHANELARGGSGMQRGQR